MPIPQDKIQMAFMNMFIVTDENRFEFAEFVEPSTVKFFEECDWIPDFRHYKNMTDDEIIADGQVMADEMNELAVKWNGMDEDTREKNADVIQRYEQLEFKMHSTAEILWTKQGHRVMPFPVVPDYDGFKVAEQEGCPYVAQQGLNPLQVLVFRVDGKKLDKKTESFPQGLIQATESILINDNLEHNQFFGDQFERTRAVSDDGKYLVTTPGKIIFNEILPDTFQYVNEASKENIEKIIPSKFFIGKGENIKEKINEIPTGKAFAKGDLESIIAQVFKRYKNR